MFASPPQNRGIVKTQEKRGGGRGDGGGRNYGDGAPQARRGGIGREEGKGGEFLVQIAAYLLPPPIFFHDRPMHHPNIHQCPPTGSQARNRIKGAPGPTVKSVTISPSYQAFLAFKKPQSFSLLCNLQQKVQQSHHHVLHAAL